jgi:hypothetical protein
VKILRAELADTYGEPKAALGAMSKSQLFVLLEAKKKLAPVDPAHARGSLFVVLSLFAEVSLDPGQGVDQPRRVTRDRHTLALTVKLRPSDGGGEMYEPVVPLVFDRVRCGDVTLVEGTFKVDFSPHLAALGDVRLGQVRALYIFWCANSPTYTP